MTYKIKCLPVSPTSSLCPSDTYTMSRFSMNDLSSVQANTPTESLAGYEAACGQIFTIEGYEKVKDSAPTPIIQITPDQIPSCINFISGSNPSYIYQSLSALKETLGLSGSCLTLEIACTPNGIGTISEECWKSVNINFADCLHGLESEITTQPEDW